MDKSTEEQLIQIAAEIARLTADLTTARRELLDAVQNGRNSREPVRRVTEIEMDLGMAEDRRKHLSGAG